MPSSKDSPDLKAIRTAGNKPRRDEVGSFLLMIIVAVVALLVAFITGIISELILLLGFIGILIFIQSRSPPFLIELAQYERAVILRYGKFQKVAGPGWVFVIPFVDDAHIVDTRVRIVDKEFTPQSVVTKDNINLQVDAIMYMKVKDPKAAVLNVRDPLEAATTYVQAHLRDIIGKMELQSVISNIHIINELLRSGVEKVAHDWGVDIVKVEIQSIELPETVMSAMHGRKAAEQDKYAAEEVAKANAIKIDAVRRAAGQLSDPALQYLYLQALEKVAQGRSSKIIFPLELTHLADRLSGGMGAKQKDKIEEDLRGKYDEFLLDEARDGTPVSTAEILKTLKKKAKKKLKK